MKERAVRAQINPLQFLEVDESRGFDLDGVLRFLCSTDLPRDTESFAVRYKEISDEEGQLFVVPAEQRILDKLIWPLRHAKAAYMTGNYLGTISLCGFVAEMVAVFRFDLARIRINNQPM
jgi:hypothetical protein